ncbi:MAG: sterol desaturase family protein [Chitinophagales bacterium]|nr:sterol desaturase family protein [Bacteroidota bacterium]MBX7139475.1 sterol desaturase family protein [Chitinophagales bacterium]
MLLSIFGAPEITFEQLRHIDSTAPQLILWATPIMIFFSAVEYWFAKRDKNDTYDHTELKGSVLVGLGNLASNFLSKLVMFAMVIVLYNLVPWRQEFRWWLFFPCYVILDFFSYWAHRISHEQRFWWATHVPHHSANHYNLSVSFRLSWIQQVKIIFFAPVILLGFHPLIFFVVNQVAVLFQFWVHTEYIPKLHPWIEATLATPSNHRVHHGSDEKYVDKNYGATFIIWDKWFGTYQKEEERPHYGLTTPVHSGNPFFLVFHEAIDIVRDVRKAKTFKEKWWYIFGSPVKIARYKKQMAAREQPVEEAA